VQVSLILASNAGIQRVPITATGVAGTKTVAQSENAIDFGKLSICQDSSQVVTLTNKGCDTLTITGADLTGQGFAYTGSLPIVLKPGESTALTVSTTTDTNGHPSSVSGMLSFTTTAQNALTPIPLTRSFEYPARLTIRAVDNASGHAGDKVKFQLLLEGDVPRTMTALHFDLTHNDDLLGFTKAVGNNLSITSTTGHEQQTQSFMLSPLTDTGIIGELSFNTYLAKASTTPLTLSNLRFDYANRTIPPDCIAAFDAAGSSFTYLYQCGERTIQGYLQSGSFVADGYPNPVSNALHIPVTIASATPTDLNVQVANSSGEIVMTERRPVSNGPQVVALDVRALPSGFYSYIVAMGSTRIGGRDFQVVH
jgi:hypothetical protein